MPLRVFLVLVCVLFFAEIAAFAGENEKREDLSGNSIILAVKAVADLENPPVFFNHSKHTKMLSPESSTCVLCHNLVETPGGPALSPKYSGVDTSAEQADKRYHEGCSSCHAARKTGGETHGPLASECKSCHTGAVVIPARKPLVFGAALHASHLASPALSRQSGKGVAAGAANCAACHHPVKLHDETIVAQAMPCSFCHASVGDTRQKYAMPGASAMGEAAHMKCISCHLGVAGGMSDGANPSSSVSATGVLSATASSGPVTCEGCHGVSAPKLRQTGRGGDFMAAGQPVTRLMLAPEGNRPAEAVGMGAPLAGVTFNHGVHERAVDSCMACHHMAFASCASCHKRDGIGDVTAVREAALRKAAGLEEKTAPFGGALALPPQAKSESGRNSGVTFYQAMHVKEANGSCISCHGVGKVERAQCAGCHTPKTAAVEQDCAFCHKTPWERSPAQQAFEDPKAPAARHDESITPRDFVAVTQAGRLAAEAAEVKIPEVVVIGSLSREYQPSAFPHGKVYRALLAGINRTAPSLEGMHTRDLTACAACHHHSPAGVVPPRCATCHDAERGGLNGRDGRPLLKAAYHLQCMGCHERMDVKEPADTNCANGCHTPRAEMGAQGSPGLAAPGSRPKS